MECKKFFSFKLKLKDINWQSIVIHCADFENERLWVCDFENESRKISNQIIQGSRNANK